ncbi:MULTISPECIES: hypothetical protein [unclassified Colwellia]|uniref:hypothetical protein n=1 Tax=unclassified Colwellia TaxID=196834 RepID=UPI0015F3E670|nr:MULTISPECIES: hypothetical protein [unclassified Colwellia]MBA6231050.1 hypothetical protein [Colwellia sp. MB02u-7]MBA6235346.1 hypothetical protein [Colwellia sp. MB02u-11]MBA6297914.1 hypothetical protein [Colwellia sp. MB3u-22]MBA6309401.1 hypothetical protein [Colwellia sp. MB3u-64]
MSSIKWNYFLTIFQVTLGIIYFSAGLSKLIPGFPNIIGPVWLIDELSKYSLGLFGYFIAIMQTLIGGLLLISRFRLIASLMLLPMHMCIFIIPISLGWQGTPFVNAIFLFMLLSLLFSDRKKIYSLINSKPLSLNLNSNKLYISTFILTWAFTIFLKYGFGH